MSILSHSKAKRRLASISGDTEKTLEKKNAHLAPGLTSRGLNGWFTLLKIQSLCMAL